MLEYEGNHRYDILRDRRKSEVNPVVIGPPLNMKRFGTMLDVQKTSPLFNPTHCTRLSLKCPISPNTASRNAWNGFQPCGRDAPLRKTPKPLLGQYLLMVGQATVSAACDHSPGVLSPFSYSALTSREPDLGDTDTVPLYERSKRLPDDDSIKSTSIFVPLDSSKTIAEKPGRSRRARKLFPFRAVTLTGFMTEVYQHLRRFCTTGESRSGLQTGHMQEWSSHLEGTETISWAVSSSSMPRRISVTIARQLKPC